MYISLQSGTKLWASDTTGLRFGTDDTFAFSTTYRGVFDTLSSFIRLPPSISEYFIAKVTEKTNMFEQNGWKTVACDDENLPSIFFLTGGYWLEVSPIDYAIDISTAQDRSICGLAIGPNTVDEIAFGLPLLRGYYSIFDVSNDRLQIAPSASSAKSAIIAGSLPAATAYFIAPVPWHTQFANFFRNNKDWWIFALGSVIVIMGLLTMLLWSGIFD